MNRLGNRLLAALLSLLLVFPCFWIAAKPAAAVTLDLEVWFRDSGGRAILNYKLTLPPTDSSTPTESSPTSPLPDLLPFDAELFYREDGSGTGILFLRLLPGEDIAGFLTALADDKMQVVNQKEISAGSWELGIQWETACCLMAKVTTAGDQTQFEVAYAGSTLQDLLLGRPRGAFVLFVPGRISETNGLEAAENAAKFNPEIEPMRVVYLPGPPPTLTEGALPSETGSSASLTPSGTSSESATPSESPIPPIEQTDSASSESAEPTSETLRETWPAVQTTFTPSASVTSSKSIPAITTSTTTAVASPPGFPLWLIVVLGVGILLLGMLIAVLLMGRKRPPRPPADLGAAKPTDVAPPPPPPPPDSGNTTKGEILESRFCGKCGCQLVPDKSFCPGCGTPVA